MKVQARNIRAYEQPYLSLPSKLCQAMGVEKGSEVKVEIAGKDSLKLKMEKVGA